MSTLIRDALQKNAERLSRILPQHQAWMETELILASILKCDRARVISHGSDAMDVTMIKKFDALIRRRLKREPLAYVLGEREFYGRIFRLDRRALIPRPETEVLVRHAVQCLDEEPRAVVWDVGTGSGAIAITIKKERPRATVIASDTSKDALSLARLNAKRLHAKGVRFFRADLLAPHSWAAIHDAPVIICANLPYLPDSDRKKLDPEVVHFEPRAALFAGRDGLSVIRRFFRELSSRLGGQSACLLLEFDPPQARTILALAKKYFPYARNKIFKDENGRSRLLELKMSMRSIKKVKK